MNFYTLTFKQKILLGLAGVALAQILVNIALLGYIKKTTTAQSYIGTKASKIDFFHRKNLGAKDAVFIGSSRTLYQVSTAQFAAAGLDIFNFGVSGMFLQEHAATLHAALKIKPRLIVIEFGADEIYKPQPPKEPSVQDLRALFGADRALFLPALWKFGANLNLFHYYREGIYIHLNALLKRKIFVGGRAQDLAQDLGQDPIQMARKTFAAYIDCDVFKSVESKTSYILTCTNGDGILLPKVGQDLGADPSAGGAQDPVRDLGQNSTQDLGQDLSAKPAQDLAQDPHKASAAPQKPNAVFLKLARQLVQTARENGAKPVLLIQPERNASKPCSAQDLERLLGAPVLEFASDDFNQSDWIDATHLNASGRLKYSKILARKIRALNP
ncbi:MAG: hypothetical protein ACTTIC_03780 [Helicobacteraceae bacterium]